MSTAEDIGRRLRRLRQARGRTQDEVAALLGVTKSTVSRIESGARGLAAGELAQLGPYLSVTTDEILFGEADDRVLARAEGDAAEAVDYARRVIDDFEYLAALGL